MNDREMILNIDSQLLSMRNQIATHLGQPVTPQPPNPQPPGGPTTPPGTVPPGPYETGVFIGKGNPDRSDGQHLTLNSGQVKCYPLPTDDSPSGSINMGEVSGAPQPRSMYVCFSKTPGLIDENGFCAKSGTQIGAVFLTRAVVTGSADRGGQTTIDGSNCAPYGYFWTPVAEGPWYVNVRYDYDMSGGPKPILCVWAPGPY